MSFETTVEPILDSLRDIACSESSSSKASPPGALIARLKAINRNSNAAATSRRETTAEARTEVTAVNLGLQNLLYEKRHLEREIEKNRKFAVIYQDVPLHSLEEFMTGAPEDMRTPEIVDDEHQLMLSRLKFELSERQQLEERRKALVLERDAILAETKHQLDEVNKLTDPFEKLAQMTLQVQKLMVSMVPEPPKPDETPEPKDESMEDVAETAA